MSVSQQKDIGSYIKGANALNGQVITAGAGNDGVEQNGHWIDRSKALSAKLIISFSAVLSEAETLSIAANFQDASDSAGSGVADYGDALANAVVATGGVGGSTEVDVVELDVDLSSADLFVRGQITADLSAAGVDTVDLAAVLVLGGYNELPPA